MTVHTDDQSISHNYYLYIGKITVSENEEIEKSV